MKQFSLEISYPIHVSLAQMDKYQSRLQEVLCSIPTGDIFFLNLFQIFPNTGGKII